MKRYDWLCLMPCFYFSCLITAAILNGIYLDQQLQQFINEIYAARYICHESKKNWERLRNMFEIGT